MSENTITESQRKHLFALLGDAGIKNREDRLSFARTVLDIDESNLTSFTQLYEGEADDLIFAARAWKTIQSLRDLNGETLKSSISFVRRYYNYSRDDEAVAKVREDDAEEPTDATGDETKATKPVRAPRRSGKPQKAAEESKTASPKAKRSAQPSSDQSRSHGGRSSKTRSGSFSSDEIGYDLDD